MIETNLTLLKMAFALSKPIQDMIPDKYDTLWCDGYYTYFRRDRCQSIENRLYDIREGAPNAPIIPCKTPFKVPRQDDIQQIYKEIKGLSFDCCYKEFKRWDAFKYQQEKYEHGTDWFNLFETGSWTVLWLSFFMETVFNQTWNGETWEAIE